MNSGVMLAATPVGALGATRRTSAEALAGELEPEELRAWTENT